MGKYLVTGCYNATKYIQRLVEADSPEEAEKKAWREDYIDEYETDEERVGGFEITEKTVEADNE